MIVIGAGVFTSIAVIVVVVVAVVIGDGYVGRWCFYF